MSMGPCDETRRLDGSARRYPGLSPGDDTLLRSWLASLAKPPEEIHTHVPVGNLPRLLGELNTAANRAQVEASYPRRIDCACRFGDGWTIVECKPEADHHALGQILCYRWWWERDLPGLRVDRVMVVTDVCVADCAGPYNAYGVVVHSCGPVLEFEASRRREVFGDRFPLVDA